MQGITTAGGGVFHNNPELAVAVTQAALAVAQSGWAALNHWTDSNGRSYHSMIGAEKDNFRDMIRQVLKGSPSAVTGEGDARAGFKDQHDSVMVVGTDAKPLPPITRWPYDVTFDQWWPMHPFYDHSPPFLNPVVALGSWGSYVPDATWKNPDIPEGNTGDIAISDFAYPIGPWYRPYMVSFNLNTMTTDTAATSMRLVPYKTHQAHKVYGFYRQCRFMFEAVIRQVVPCKNDIYVFLVVPRDMRLSTTTAGTGAKPEGGDAAFMPPAARTKPSLAVNNTIAATGQPTNQDFPANLESQLARLEALKRSEYVIGYCKFPANGSPAGFYTSGKWDGTVEDANTSDVAPGYLDHSVRRLSFNCLIPDLMQVKAFELESQSTFNYPQDFVGSLSYLPQVAGAAMPAVYSYGFGATTFGTSQIAGNVGIQGFRLVWLSTGPSLQEQADIVGHDQNQATEVDVVTSRTESNLLISTDPHTGLYAGSFRVESRVGCQFEYFDPRPDSVEANLGLGFAIA